MRRAPRLAVLALGALAAGPGATESAFTRDEIVEIAAEAGIDPDLLLLQGDSDYGAYLAGECTTCHQINGDGASGIPPIHLLPDVYFKVAMYEFKEKQRENPVMQMIAGRLGHEEIAALAAYFAQLE